MPIDPVCGMQVTEDEALTSAYQGQIYYFDSEDCRDEFIESPEDYVGEGLNMALDEEE
jgi:YHS domain-containing protein